MGVALTMRLDPKDREIICEEVRRIDPKAGVFLFGSRVDDMAKGGDIDLLVESQSIGFSEKIEILAAIKAIIGEQKIDLILTRDRHRDPNPFVQMIAKQVVPL